MQRIFDWIVPEIMIDIGAYKGEFTKMVLDRSPSCQVVMVEPNDLSETFLKEIGRPYELISLSDKAEKKAFYYEKINPLCTGASLFLENTGFYSNGKYGIKLVDTFTLDSRNYFADNQIDLIKIDTQGSELNIINGGLKTLSRTKWVLLETSLYPYNQGAPLANVVIRRMQELGFQIADILEFNQSSGMIIQMDVLFQNKNN